MQGRQQMSWLLAINVVKADFVPQRTRGNNQGPGKLRRNLLPIKLASADVSLRHSTKLAERTLRNAEAFTNRSEVISHV